MRERMTRKLVSLLLVFALVAANFFSYATGVANAEEPVLTVADAIANNTGSGKTVEGYIVGVLTSGSGGSAKYLLKGSDPFVTTTATNIAIADSPTETVNTKIMPVQLVSGTAVREALNLTAHPENVGKKVRITGTLGLYYTVPGLKTPTAAVFPDDVVVDPEPTEMSIAAAKGQAGKTVTVEGIVTADNAVIGGGKLSTYLQDGTAGINLFASSLTGYPQLKEGDKVRVTGLITSYKGLTEIAPSSASDVAVLSAGNALPAAQAVTLAELSTQATGERYEGSLVKTTAYVSYVPETASGGGYNVSLYDAEFNGTTLRVLPETGVIAGIQAGKWYEFTAIVGQYDTYQLIPRKASDVQLSAEQPGEPKPADRYASTISRTVDGDTAHLSTPVLGATTVRMLSIDTPETNFEGQSQGYHGEAAKLALKELLPVGTAVEIETADKPFDGYGRLLAHIHKGDMDVNREMVRLGMAVPYFIWPNVEHFEAYAEATKDAMAEGRGIWDPTNPLAELPYEFRFNSRGGADKYVGDFFTKEFLPPSRWKEIPVENRIFFFTEQEAVDAGYTLKSDPPINVQLLSINDLHGKIDQQYLEDANGDGKKEEQVGRMDYLATYLKEREATNPNTLIVHAGDAVGGSSPVSALFQDEPTVEIMEAIGFDVGTIGNHELDEGVEEMLRLNNGGTHPNGTENYDGINFPMIAANVVYKDTHEHVLPPYAIQEVGGKKIGFVGVVTRSAAGMVMPAGIQNIEFTNEAAAVNEAVAELKAQGVRAIAVLAHMDATQSGSTVTGPAADLANAVDDEVDVIFAAHNHKIVNGTVDNKLIVQAYEYGKAFVDVELKLDPLSGDVLGKSAEIVYVDQNGKTPDAAVAGILANYANRIAPILNEVVGEADVDMEGGYASYYDNALGNLIADSMKAAMNTDFALMNGGGIRDNLNAGPITWGELYNILPFNNVLTSLEITGADLFPILNAQISKAYGSDYSIAGFRYTWDAATYKVVDIFLPDGTKIDKTKTYTLTVNNFMATSTSSKYRPIGQLGQNPVTGPEDLEALIAFVKAGQEPFAYEREGRIQTVQEDTVLGAVSIADARAAGTDKIVTVEGVVTTAPGVWGAKRFYIQNGTDGLFIDQDLFDVVAGDRLKVTGTTAEVNGEFRLFAVSSVEKLASGEEVEPQKISPAAVSKDNEGEMVRLKDVQVADLQVTNKFGSFQFYAVNGVERVLVKVDYRTGMTVDSLGLKNGDYLDLRGISSQYRGEFEVKIHDGKHFRIDNSNKHGQKHGNK